MLGVFLTAMLLLTFVRDTSGLVSHLSDYSLNHIYLICCLVPVSLSIIVNCMLSSTWSNKQLQPFIESKACVLMNY